MFVIATKKVLPYILIFLAAFAFFSMLQEPESLGDPDTYYHAKMARLMSELERLKRERLDSWTPALQEQYGGLLDRYEAVQSRVAEAAEKLDRLKDELLAEAVRRKVRLSRDYEDSIRAMRATFAAELENLADFYRDAPLALPAPAGT